jgi:hypothetical protein
MKDRLARRAGGRERSGKSVRTNLTATGGPLFILKPIEDVSNV